MNEMQKRISPITGKVGKSTTQGSAKDAPEPHVIAEVNAAIQNGPKRTFLVTRTIIAQMVVTARTVEDAIALFDADTADTAVDVIDAREGDSA